MRHDTIKKATLEKEIQRCPSEGSGVHSWIWACANLGAEEDVPESQLVQMIKDSMSRAPSPRNEVETAVQKAMNGHGKKSKITFKKISVRERVFRRLAQSPLSCRDLVSMSPIPVGSPTDLQDQRSNLAALLRNLYEPQELVWLGERFDTLAGIKQAERWAQIIEQGGRIPSQWIPNPLDGKEHDIGGKMSYRCDDAVCAFKYVVCECDRFPTEMQAAFWMKNKRNFPLVAIIYSGGKSLHAILKSGIKTREGWENVIENGLFPKTLVPLGFDPQTRNESRLSRTPGHYRSEKGKLQSLLWMDKV
jgi:hypothetical protein